MVGSAKKSRKLWNATNVMVKGVETDDAEVDKQGVPNHTYQNSRVAKVLLESRQVIGSGDAGIVKLEPARIGEHICIIRTHACSRSHRELPSKFLISMVKLR